VNRKLDPVQAADDPGKLKNNIPPTAVEMISVQRSEGDGAL
jgi:hypothetical protein